MKSGGSDDGKIFGFVVSIAFGLFALMRWALVSDRKDNEPFIYREQFPRRRQLPQSDFVVSSSGARLSTRSIRRRDLKTLTRWEFIVRGYSHPCHADGVIRSIYYAEMDSGDKLKLVREPSNPYGATAILIYADCDKLDGIDLGYVPSVVSPEISGLIDSGIELEAYATTVDLSKIHNGFNLLYAEVVRRKPVADRPKKERKPRKIKKAETIPTDPDRSIDQR